MKQELIDLLDEIRKLGHQAAHTFTIDLAHDDMDADQWGRLQDLLKVINLKSQESFLFVANLRRMPAKCKGDCGMNYCDENGCTERNRVLTSPIQPEFFGSYNAIP